MKALVVAALAALASFASTTFAADITITSAGAETLAKHFHANGAEAVRGNYTVKKLTCRVKALAGSPQPYTDCEYVTIGATSADDWNNNDMGTKSAYETYQALKNAKAKPSALKAEDTRNKYVGKISAKKVICEVSGKKCVVTQ